ncbi:MAG: radical SAM protein [Anaerolineae bacterium]|nr:radical SAM protein [Anaerolineae bacterium]
MHSKKRYQNSNKLRNMPLFKRGSMRRLRQIKFYQRYLRTSLKKLPTTEIIRIANPFWLSTPSMPPMLSLEFTNYCNLRCPYCSSPDNGRDKGYMSQTTFSNLLAQFETPGIHFVRIVGGGEPTLHPNFADFASRLAVKTSFLTLITNWQHVDDQTLQAVIEAPVDMISISVDGMNKTEYEKWRVGGDFERLLDNLKRLRSAKAAAHADILICIRLMLHPTQQEKTHDMIKFWRQYSDTVQTQPILHFGDNEPVGTFTPQTVMKRCAMPFRTLDIHWNGNVSMCSYSKCQLDNPNGLQLGNINDTSLETMWNSPTMQQCRNRHRTRQPELFPLCNDCPGAT